MNEDDALAREYMTASAENFRMSTLIAKNMDFVRLEQRKIIWQQVLQNLQAEFGKSDLIIRSDLQRSDYPYIELYKDSWQAAGIVITIRAEGVKYMKDWAYGLIKESVSSPFEGNIDSHQTDSGLEHFREAKRNSELKWSSNQWLGYNYYESKYKIMDDELLAESCLPRKMEEIITHFLQPIRYLVSAAGVVFDRAIKSTL